MTHLDDSSSTESPAIKIYKLGPWELDDPTARVIGNFIVPITYSYILFVKAMEGPSEFLVALWKLSVMALAFNVLRRIRGWHKDGSSEVWFAPAEDLWQKVKQHCLEMITTLLRELAHAVATALQELDAEDDE
ncbi:hypothetical protein SLS60_002464 [Paraconiothyrium brasiliense]|uniref:Uncharacterized protein n=1 Tax=Paraconiothyrium brasiliense TaxID=300254 RepID=A0ABR3S276_9PLEO